MAFYQRKQTVQAEKLTKENVQQVVDWCNGVQVEEVDPLDPEKKFVAVNFPTMTGNKRVSEGEYLVKDVGGFYRWEAEDFEKAFERINI